MFSYSKSFFVTVLVVSDLFLVVLLIHMYKPFELLILINRISPLINFSFPIN